MLSLYGYRAEVVTKQRKYWPLSGL